MKAVLPAPKGQNISAQGNAPVGFAIFCRKTRQKISDVPNSSQVGIDTPITGNVFGGRTFWRENNDRFSGHNNIAKF
jgi:hypothetical protein